MLVAQPDLVAVSWADGQLITELDALADLAIIVPRGRSRETQAVPSPCGRHAGGPQGGWHDRALDPAMPGERVAGDLALRHARWSSMRACSPLRLALTY